MRKWRTPSSAFERSMALAGAMLLEAYLSQANGNVKIAAKFAGVNRTHFYDLCDRYGVTIRASNRLHPTTDSVIQTFKAWITSNVGVRQ